MAPSDLVGSSSIVIKSDYSGIPHCDEGGDVEQVARISITILCLCDWVAFDLSNSYSFIFRTNILVVFILLSKLFV